MNCRHRVFAEPIPHYGVGVFIFKRLQQFFGYEHRFEAYVPKAKRVLGYFALPVLIGDTVVAAIDLKADREKRKLVIQQWTWMSHKPSKEQKYRVDEELGRFERFQLA